MASRIGAYPCAAILPHRKHNRVLAPMPEPATQFGRGRSARNGQGLGMRVRVSDGGDSYLDMWKKAVDKDRKSLEFQKIVENLEVDAIGGGVGVEGLERKSEEFQKILEVPKEERDRIQKLQVIDRAAAAIAAARAVLEEKKLEGELDSGESESLGIGGTKTSQEGKFVLS